MRSAPCTHICAFSLYRKTPRPTISTFDHCTCIYNHIQWPPWFHFFRVGNILRFEPILWQSKPVYGWLVIWIYWSPIRTCLVWWQSFLTRRPERFTRDMSNDSREFCGTNDILTSSEPKASRPGQLVFSPVRRCVSYRGWDRKGIETRSRPGVPGGEIRRISHRILTWSNLLQGFPFLSNTWNLLKSAIFNEVFPTTPTIKHPKNGMFALCKILAGFFFVGFTWAKDIGEGYRYAKVESSFSAWCPAKN